MYKANVKRCISVGIFPCPKIIPLEKKRIVTGFVIVGKIQPCHNASVWQLCGCLG